MGHSYLLYFFGELIGRLCEKFVRSRWITVGPEIWRQDLV